MARDYSKMRVEAAAAPSALVPTAPTGSLATSMSGPTTEPPAATERVHLAYDGRQIGEENNLGLVGGSQAVQDYLERTKPTPTNNGTSIIIGGERPNRGDYVPGATAVPTQPPTTARPSTRPIRLNSSGTFKNKL